MRRPFVPALQKAKTSGWDTRDPSHKEKADSEEALTRLLSGFWQEQAERLHDRIDARAIRVRKAAVTGTLRKDSPDLLDQLSLGDEFWSNEDEWLYERLVAWFTQSAQGSVALEHAATSDRFGLKLDPTLTNAEAAKWARQYSAKLVKRINKTTRESIRQSLATWIDTPSSTLQDLMDQLPFGEERARLIAVTEVTAAYGQGEKLFTEELRAQYPGLKIARIHHTNNDDRVCSICGERDGKEITSDDEELPLHPG